ncbi:MAG: chromate transporter [Clostridia bacterium]|nr:chromate transporter [Clostridia bacterium]
MIYLQLFLTFFKIGLFTFGGGYAMIPLIEEEMLAHAWMDTEQLINFMAVSESTPGPFAINIATYVGSVTAPIGLLGSACATLGVVLPSFLIILLVARMYQKFKTNRIVAGCMNGLKPAVVGLIAGAVVTMGSAVFFPAGWALSVLTSYWFIVSSIIFVGMLVLVFKKAHPIVVVALSAALGIAAGVLQPWIG